MASTINASTSPAAIVQTADGTGILSLQTAGTTAVTIDASQRAAFVAGTAALPAITTTGDTDTGIWFPAANTVAASTSGTEAMRIDSSGNVGIGTTSPSNKLDVFRSTFGGANTSFMLSSVNSVSAKINYSGIGYSVDQGAAGIEAGSMYFSTYGSGALTERMRIDASGNVGIGSTSPGQKLHVDGGTGMSAAALIARFFGTSSQSMLIRGNGNVENSLGGYGVISDIKLKENVVDATSKLDEITKLKVRNYNLIGSDIKQIGFVAQEIEQVFPNIVSESSDLDENGNDLGTVTKTVKTSVLIPILVKAIQEQQALITSLTARITALEGA